MPKHSTSVDAPPATETLAQPGERGCPRPPRWAGPAAAPGRGI